MVKSVKDEVGRRLLFGIALHSHRIALRTSAGENLELPAFPFHIAKYSVYQK
jgi:hypothetical protein